MTMNVSLVYITTGSKEEAKKIGMALVSNRLVACVNIIDGVESLYWWEGTLQDEQEAVLIAKTKETLVGEVVEKVKSLHSYSCPCVVSVPLTGGNEAFLEWVRNETR
jgi:periplasmic divalent cation tolerance protein